ncbi:MAG TPA: stage V sporulation protein S [Anaerolineae bacterium]|nr:stage V sporulation protein S [Anaerolineae bacterium]
MTSTTKLLRVAGNSSPNHVAGAIAGQVREGRQVALQAIGPIAVNQAVKSIAVARDYLVPEGIDIVCLPEFVDVPVNGKTLTAIRFDVEAWDF